MCINTKNHLWFNCIKCSMCKMFNVTLVFPISANHPPLQTGFAGLGAPLQPAPWLPTAGSLGSLTTARAAAHPCPVSSSVPTLVTSAHVTVENLRLGEGYKHTLEHLGCGIKSQLLTLLLTAGRYHHSAQNYFSLKITKLKGT